MKIITLETLKTMPNGTVFSEIDKYGEFKHGIHILTGRFEDCSGFDGEMSLYPWLALDKNEEYGIFEILGDKEFMKDKDFQTEWITDDTSPVDYEENQLFAVFSKAEVGKMIKVLQWALSDLEDDFDMDEVLI